VLLVEDLNVVRRRLAVSLVADPAVRLVGAPRSVEEALGLMPGLNPDVVVVGNRPAGASALKAVKVLRRRFPGTGVILVGAHPTADLLAAIRAGAAAHLALDVDLPTLRTVVRRVAAGEYLINRQVTDREDAADWVMAPFRAAAPDAPRRHTRTTDLSERDREVLRELANGKSVEELRAVLGQLLRLIARKLEDDSDDEPDDRLKSGAPLRPPGPWSPPGHLRTAVPLPGAEQER
jgi:DNA-binding NarL/FixJ family response regulator